MRVFIGPYRKRGDGPRPVRVRIDKCDLWSLDYTLALVILPASKAFRKRPVGIWGHMFPENYHTLKGRLRTTAERRAARKQDAILGRMIDAFEIIVADDLTTEKADVVQEGLNLFAEHYRALWQ